MPKRTRKSKKGGKFIGEGSYGCGFLPSLKCVGRPRSDEISLSKMITIKHEAEDEYEISKMIEQIDPTRKYFITAESMCEHDQSDIRPNNETGKCKKFPLKGPTYLIMYENGGVDLSEINIPANLYPGFFLGLIELIEGLVKLHSNGMVHLDIKPDNVVGKFYTDIQKYKIRYIDFGLSEKTANLRGDDERISALRNFNLKRSYPYYPFDLVMTSLNRQKNPYISYEEINTWYDYQNEWQFYTVLPFDSYLMPDGTRKYNEETLSDEYAKTAKWYTNISDHLKSIDVYGLAVSLCIIYRRLTGHVRVYENGKIVTGIAIEEEIYSINDDTLRTHYGDEIYNFHKSLAILSAKFYEQILPFLLPFGNLRPKASDLLRIMSPLLSSTENIFKNPKLTYKAFRGIGIPLEKPLTIVSTPPPATIKTQISNNDDFPVALKVVNKSKWTQPMNIKQAPKRTRKNRRSN